MIGKVLDASLVASLVRGSIAVQAWLETARQFALPLYVPSLALVEVRAVRPDSSGALADLLDHPTIVVRELDATTAAAVGDVLDRAGDGVFDALAGQVVVVARQRTWPVLTADPARLRRLDPDLEVQLI